MHGSKIYYSPSTLSRDTTGGFALLKQDKDKDFRKQNQPRKEAKGIPKMTGIPQTQGETVQIEESSAQGSISSETDRVSDMFDSIVNS